MLQEPETDLSREAELEQRQVSEEIQQSARKDAARTRTHWRRAAQRHGGEGTAASRLQGATAQAKHQGQPARVGGARGKLQAGKQELLINERVKA